MNGSVKYSNLLWYGNNYCRKKFYGIDKSNAFDETVQFVKYHFVPIDGSKKGKQKLIFFHRYQKSKNRLLKVCYVQTTSASLQRVSFFFSFFVAAAIDSTNEANKVPLSSLSIFLDVYVFFNWKSKENLAYNLQSLKL